MKRFMGCLSWVGLYVVLPIAALILAIAAGKALLVLLFFLGLLIIVARLIFPDFVRRLWYKYVPLVNRLLTELEGLLRRLRSKIRDDNLASGPSPDSLKDRFVGRPSIPEALPASPPFKNPDSDSAAEPSLRGELHRLMDEQSLFGGLRRLIGALAVRGSRLSNKDLLLGAFLLVSVPLLVLVVDKGPPPPHDGFKVVIVFVFWAAVCFAAFCLIRWLLRRVTRSACPSIGRLKDLLAERLPAGERARLTAHLDFCPVCQHRVEGLSMGHNSWPGLARKLTARPAEPEPALRKVMAQLKENPEETTDDEPALAGDLPLDFLTPSDKPDHLGRLERYEVMQEIGRGGMGVVLKAFDPSLHRVVAIKVLAPQLATSGVARKRFLREAKAAAAVTHDHIVTIHAVDEANGLPYLVMQYVPGQSLQDRIDKDGPLDLTDVLRIGMQTASALAAAHTHGIVHRDIKPANILLEEGVQRVMITDFGLARAMDDASLTQSGFVAGSPLYMAPEQARGEALDHRADLFSLGSVLYTMCTGRPPFRAANTLAVLRRVSEDTPRPIRETNPEVPDWLTDIVARLMAKEPAVRLQSAAEVEEVLGRHLAQLQHAAWTPPPRPPAPPAAHSDVVGLPTSVTMCPSCGANLHVPERMVGSIVHCSECGKPFHVEEGSEVMQVAKPARWPVRPRFGLWRKLRGCLLFVAAGFGLLVILSVLYFAFEARRAEHMAALVEARVLHEEKASQPQPVLTSDYWMATLNGLPPEATLFGAIDPYASGPGGSINLDNAWIQSLVRLVFPGKAANQLTLENLGHIEIGRLALGYYEGSKTKDARMVVHLTGMALDGHKRIVDFIRHTAGDQVQVEELDKRMGANGPVCVSSPEWPFALKILDDSHAYLAASLSRDAKASPHRKLLDPLPAAGIGAGYNPPWIKNALSTSYSQHGCGVFLGEIPAEWRLILTHALRLRECPRTFACYLTREGGGIALYLNLKVEKSGADRALREDLEKWRPRALKELQGWFPLLKKDQQGSALLGQILNNMHWKSSDGSVQTEVRIPGSTWKSLGEALTRISRMYAEEQKQW
jgi:hypothetical protein